MSTPDQPPPFAPAGDGAGDGGGDAAGDGITFALIPDTQLLAVAEPDLYLGATAWLAAHADRLGLAMALHLGDVVNNGADDEAQYDVAARAHRTLLDAGVPLLVAPGNHDYDDMLARSRDLSMFNRYVGQRQLGHRCWLGGTYEPGATENCYATVDAGGSGYLFVSLEFAPRPPVVAWAEDLLRRHRERYAVVVTHGYLDPDGGRTRPGSKYHPQDYPGSTDGLDGEDLWTRALRDHPNLVAVFCGHQIPETVSYRVDAAEYGNPVLQSFQNWQSTPRGGAGRIRLVRFEPGTARIRMCVVNTASGEYEKDDGYDVDLSLAAGSPDVGRRYPQS